jgi:hypothetical protein
MKPERGKRLSLLAVAGTIAWSFLGVRRRAAHESRAVSPPQILAAGVIGAAIFVAVLVALARVIVASAG